MTSDFASHVESWLRLQLPQMRAAICDSHGNWSMRAFIDVYAKLYPMTSDTKVTSKIVEIMLMPVLFEGIKSQGWTLEMAEHQNHYPDLTIVGDDGMVAIDLKTTYVIENKHPEQVDGFTLGAFTGYFRDRSSTKNSAYPYDKYDQHLVLGVIHRRRNELSTFSSLALEELDAIDPVLTDIRFVVQPKYAVASDVPGSGNTKNIGSIRDLTRLLDGLGPFTKFDNPEAVFDDYWMHYMTKDMARTAGSSVPYSNLSEYLEYKT